MRPRRSKSAPGRELRAVIASAAKQSSRSKSWIASSQGLLAMTGLPNVVTFWHGPLDRLRQLCLRSQVAAGHNVTVYSFEPLTGLPDGVGNSEAEAILPHSFAEKLRPTGPDGVWRDWTTLQFSDFFRMRLMARSEGLWLDADVLLLKPVETDPAKPFFAWERPRQLGNSVLYLP